MKGYLEKIFGIWKRISFKEIMVGAILMTLGVIFCMLFYPEVMGVIKGALGPGLLILGFLIAWIGYEDLSEGL